MEIIEEKIQVIAKEMQEAKASQWTTTKIIKALTETGETNEKKLREKALEMLLELDPAAATIYERFSKMKVYASNETIKGFNRGYIITSLLKETGLSRSVAEKITTEVENEIKDAKINFLTPGLIRELVNAKLIAYGFEEIRNRYTRLGLPVHDIEKTLEEKPMDGEALREYNLLLKIPKKAREMHFEGKIFIEDVEGFSHRPFAYTFIAERKETLEKTIIESAKQLVQKRKYFYLTPNIFGVTFACAGFVKNDSQAKKAAALIKEVMSVPEEDFSTSLELYTHKAVDKYGGDRINAAKISDKLLGEEGTIACVDSKYCLKLVKPKGKNFFILNNSVEEYYPLNKNLFSTTRGIILFVNINLEKLAEDGDEEKFLQRIRDVAEEVQELKKAKLELLAQRSYLKEFAPEEMRTAIGITSLFKAAENFDKGKIIETANKIYKEINASMPEELLFGLWGEKAKKKFEGAAQKEIFSQEILSFDECLNSKKCCFTGKAASAKEVNELIEKKVKLIEYVGRQE